MSKLDLIKLATPQNIFLYGDKFGRQTMEQHLVVKHLRDRTMIHPSIDYYTHRRYQYCNGKLISVRYTR